ncbi:proton-dependent oligopeptide transporter, POT family [Mesonia phycicola]|uniref:Proton-dependent oligopeptide transporter, POT family n=1 Tax=Mesonia phycicola TaxID=579105 RepID=A0A1M6HH75_9FLAO|nr:peptide MFS transporter [Mesonia phycicola]SHJ21532.1 proton-dependent oligopeptide transporter, POT family [Mesonia phycicola]
MNSQVIPAHKKELFGHPVGLYILFLTEMWERFSYYGMRAILTLYMVARTTEANPGLGWSNGEALALYGWYTMLVYVMSIPGGMIADKLIGQKKSVLYGAIILCFGHGVLAIEHDWAFYTGLGLIILGVGLLKPNVSTLVGGLYKEGDIRRDKGFSIFYIGINLGSLLATTSVAIVAKEYGWHYGFGLAGIAMLIGLIVYIWGQKFLTHVGNHVKEENGNEVSIPQLYKDIFNSPMQLAVTGILLAASLYGWYALGWAYGLLFIFLSAITALMMMIYKDLELKVNKDRYLVLLLSFLIVIVFWGAFEQAGGLMNIYTQEKTNRVLLGYEIPAAMFQGLNAAFIILFATAIAGFWAKRKLKGNEASSLFKMAVGVIIMGLGFVFMVFASMEFEAEGSSAMYWLVLAYLFHTIGELCASPVALSFITKLAPLRYASLMMGVYFAATGLGNKVAGLLGEGSEELGEKTIFLGITIFTVIFGLLVIAILKPLKRLTHGAEDKERKLDEVEDNEPFELEENI